VRFSFDFDGCLGHNKAMQLLASCLCEAHEVFILTSRDGALDNRDLFEVARAVGIAETNVIFASDSGKAEHFARRGIDLHFDDNMSDVHTINALFDDALGTKPAVLVNYEFGERNNTADW
jgi:hypothetical protein